MFGDVELTVACASELLKKVPEFDVILTAEAKGIPLAYEMSRQSGKLYIPARKGPKLYMEEPVVVEDRSITTEEMCIRDRYTHGLRKTHTATVSFSAIRRTRNRLPASPASHGTTGT